MAHTVLIADDNQYLREKLCELFDDEIDFTVCGQAENGKDAVNKAQMVHPDLILLDLSMPVMNGLEAARILKQLMPQVPVIMFTAFSDAFTESVARSAGVREVVSKSQSTSTLLGKARSLIHDRAA